MMTWLDPYLPLLALSRSPGSARTSLEQDLSLVAQTGVSHIICLQEPFELDLFDESIASRRAAVEALGMVFTHEPVEDYGVPSLAQMRRIVEVIAEHEERSQKVLVHCQAGLGRAGTVAACAMWRVMAEPEGAMAMVRYLRPGAIQSERQETFIVSFFDWMKSQTKSM